MITRPRPLLPGYYVLLVVLLYLPIAVLVLFSINDATTLSFPLQGITADWYRGMMSNSALLASVRSSVLVAVTASTMATALGTLAAIGIARHRFRGKAVFAMVALLPLMMPYLILGVSFLILLAALDLPRNLLTVALAHTVVALPYAVLIVTVRLVGFDRSLEEAARDLGAGYGTILHRVVVPLARPAMIAAWLVSFTVSFDEFIIASFTVGRNPTLPVYLFGQLRFANRLPQVVALAVVMMVASLLLVLLAERLQRPGAGLGDRRERV